MLNGRGSNFAKNDNSRVRVVCKFKESCNYIVLVSTVERTHTIWIRTLIPKHTRGRVFDNKSAKAD